MENLTAEQLLAGLGNGDPVVLVLNLLAFICGLGMHVWQKMRAEGITFNDYWSKYGMNSVASIAALVTTFVSMSFMAPEAPLYAYFSMAFMGDALLNKPPVNETRQLRATRGFKEDLETFKDEAGNKLDELKDKIVALEKVEPIKVWGSAIFFVIVILAVL